MKPCNTKPIHRATAAALAKTLDDCGYLSAEVHGPLADCAAEVERDNAALRELLEQMLNVAENADETGYVTDCGFIDLDKLHEQVRAALKP